MASASSNWQAMTAQRKLQKDGYLLIQAFFKRCNRTLGDLL